MRNYDWVSKLKKGDKIRLRPQALTGDAEQLITILTDHNYKKWTKKGPIFTVRIIHELRGARTYIYTSESFDDSLFAARFEPVKSNIKVYLNGTGKRY